MYTSRGECLPARGGKRMAIKPRNMSEEHIFSLMEYLNLSFDGQVFVEIEEGRRGTM